MEQEINKIFYSNLPNDRIKMNWNKNPIKMGAFLKFLKIKVERSNNHLGHSNGWTQLRNDDFDLIIGGGIVNGTEYLDTLQFGKNLKNIYNNYVNPFYLFDIFTKEGKIFFIEYYQDDINKLIEKIKYEKEYLQNKLDKQNNIYNLICKDAEQLKCFARYEAERSEELLPAVVRCVKNQENWFEAIDKWEASFECNECGNNNHKRFKYERSVANGEVWICKNKKCGAELIVDHRPNEDDF